MKKGSKNVAAGSAPLARNDVTGVTLHSAHGGPEKTTAAATAGLAVSKKRRRGARWTSRGFLKTVSKGNGRPRQHPGDDHLRLLHSQE